jgi:single-strand DNA-binding protein
MASFNKVILIGNLVENPELKMTPSSTAVTSFRIAVNRRFAKEGQQDTDFITVVCWRNTAEFVTKHFTKGKSILVCGQLQSRSWVDKDGKNRSTLEVVADEVSFVEKKMESNSASVETAPYKNEMQFEEMTPDEDLPF